MSRLDEPHKQALIAIKGDGQGEGECVVNGIPMAMIDEGMCDLVRFLNAIPEIQTTSSCINFPDVCGYRAAFVTMVIHGDILAIAKSIFDAVNNVEYFDIPRLVPDIKVEITYSMTDHNPNIPTVTLESPTECINKVTEAIKKLAHYVNRLTYIKNRG